MLTITLYWLHKAPSIRSLGKNFPARGKTTTATMLQTVIEILYEHIVDALIKPITPDAPSSIKPTLDHVKIIIDSTFIPLPKAEKDPKYYHPKSPTKSALKVEIDCDLRHRIVCVSAVVKGSVHDMKLVRGSGILAMINDNTKAIADKGYIGQLPITTPARTKRRPSTEVQQLENESTRRHELESERAAVETINQRFKQWAVVGRGWKSHYEDLTYVNKVVHVLCALVNVTLEEHPIRHGRPLLPNR